jgi:hypothetical protein
MDEGHSTACHRLAGVEHGILLLRLCNTHLIDKCQDRALSRTTTLQRQNEKEKVQWDLKRNYAFLCSAHKEKKPVFVLIQKQTIVNPLVVASKEFQQKQEMDNIHTDLTKFCDPESSLSSISILYLELQFFAQKSYSFNKFQDNDKYTIYSITPSESTSSVTTTTTMFNTILENISNKKQTPQIDCTSIGEGGGVGMSKKKQNKKKKPYVKIYVKGRLRIKHRVRVERIGNVTMVQYKKMLTPAKLLRMSEKHK